ncbi:molecular chaperone DnaK [Cuniculiplasma divulgatum]|uniref:Chaperone protein DnaK n=1 Tax=Cuniculiplasma divulgatum TaxID=1673428 RepID=A0A1N5UXW8_9ARCH|nr:molecular chaperone DnaK [Cuniculiplasma divulgatum]SIM65743.1 molecular chaperone DnaK [Cuniculiplasma divulgatum]
MSKIIGIDLGTSNSAAAVVISGKPTIIPSAEGISVGGKSFPSYVAFTKDGELLVGEPARRQALLNPEGTIYAAKRKMGSDYKYKINGKEYTPQQISSYILQKIKRDAEAYLGETISEAVITVPAYFDDNQRQATKDAGTIAGLNVKRIINEPTAASLAYGIDKVNQSMKILVYDLGGGTLDVTVMDFGEGVFEVDSTSGDTKLGGTDMDDAIIKYLMDEFKRTDKVDLSKDEKAKIRLKDAAEKAKIELSTTLETEINLPYLTVVNNEPKNMLIKLKRSKLEELIAPIVARSKEPLEKALKEANLTKDKVDKIILVGGPTRIPYVRKFVEDFFGKKAEGGVDPMECVAIGAAIQGAVLTGEIKDIVLLDVTPLTLGIETLGGVATPIIPANTTIPTQKSQIFSTAADGQTEVTIHVVQGDRAMAKDNVSLGMFNLQGIPPAPRGIPQIEVTFDIDANGILTVTAKDKATNKQQRISIEAKNKLSKDQIEKMKKEAEEFAEADKKRKEEIEKVNLAETLAYTTEKTISENKDKIDQKDQDEATELIKQLRDAIKDNDAEKIDSLSEELSKKAQAIGMAMYSKAQENQSQQSSETPDETKDQENGQTEGQEESQ